MDYYYWDKNIIFINNKTPTDNQGRPANLGTTVNSSIFKSFKNLIYKNLKEQNSFVRKI